MQATLQRAPSRRTPSRLAQAPPGRPPTQAPPALPCPNSIVALPRRFNAECPRNHPRGEARLGGSGGCMGHDGGCQGSLRKRVLKPRRGLALRPSGKRTQALRPPPIPPAARRPEGFHEENTRPKSARTPLRTTIMPLRTVRTPIRTAGIPIQMTRPPSRSSRRPSFLVKTHGFRSAITSSKNAESCFPKKKG